MKATHTLSSCSFGSVICLSRRRSTRMSSPVQELSGGLCFLVALTLVPDLLLRAKYLLFAATTVSPSAHRRAVFSSAFKN
jgi:hypothetical protein